MSDIHLYNTRTRSKEPFRPIDAENVRMYVCGPTVYDRAHIGNARPVVVFDVLFRLLRHVYGEGAVTYARNITDVDDKINDHAAKTGRTIREITDETIAWYTEDVDALGALRPTHEPRCTEYIPQMVAMAETLIGQGHAYEADGHVLFAVESYDRYGALAGRSLDEMIEGARIEVAPYKRDPLDFVLWKPSTPEQPGWDSPWGRGRPGWHIECSAMAQALLGNVFDIHGGGIDLAFPHHENEVAQSCCANHTDVMANVWMHNGFLQVEGEKMAKSAGNFFTVEELLEGIVNSNRQLYFPSMFGVEIRLALLTAHYRHPLDWTLNRTREVRRWLLKWSALANERPGASSRSALNRTGPSPDVLEALADDLNTPKAIAVLHSLFDAAQPATNKGNLALSQLLASCELLGLDWNLERKIEIGQVVEKALYQPKIEALLEKRRIARAEKNFTKSDAIRGFLQAAGVIVEDGKEPPWRFGDDSVGFGWQALCPVAQDGHLSITLDEVLRWASKYRVEIKDDGYWSTSDRGLDHCPVTELLDFAEKEFLQ